VLVPGFSNARFIIDITTAVQAASPGANRLYLGEKQRNARRRRQIVIRDGIRYLAPISPKRAVKARNVGEIRQFRKTLQPERMPETKPVDYQSVFLAATVPKLTRISLRSIQAAKNEIEAIEAFRAFREQALAEEELFLMMMIGEA